MENIIIFNKNIKNSDDQVLESWAGISELIQTQMQKCGFGKNAIKEFIEYFKPIFHSFSNEMLVPVIPRDTEQHIAFDDALNALILSVREHTAKLINERYIRELEIFTLNHFPPVAP